MPGAAKFIGGCDCDCPRTLCAQVNCPDGTPVSGASVTLYDDDTPPQVVGSCTTDANGHCCFSNKYPVPANYGLRVSKTGYVIPSGGTVSNVTGSITCGADKTVVFTFCKTSVQVKVLVGFLNYFGDPPHEPYAYTGTCFLPGCAAVGAYVSITGDATASGTTDANGVFEFTLAKPSGKCLADLNVAVTPPSGYGAASKSASLSLGLCGDGCIAFQLRNDSDHVAPMSGGRYLPKILNYSDSLGSATLNAVENYPYPKWSGSYTYTSAKATHRVTCHQPPNAFEPNGSDVLRCLPEAGGVQCRVDVYLQDVGSYGHGSPYDSYGSGIVWIGCDPATGFAIAHTRNGLGADPACDRASPKVPCYQANALASCPSQSPQVWYGIKTYNLTSSSINITGTLAKPPDYNAGSIMTPILVAWPEPPGTYTITGTI